MKKLERALYQLELLVASTNNLYATDLEELATDKHFKIDASYELQTIWKLQRALKAVKFFIYVSAIVLTIGVFVWIV